MKKRVLVFILLMGAMTMLAQRQVEELNRGLIVVYPNTTSAYLSWRLLAKDDWTMGFNVYRSVDGAAATKLNTTPITNSTNFTDPNVNPAQNNAYFVRTVVDGVELETSETFAPEANTTYRQFFPIALRSTGSQEYDVLHVYVGDVDGDGDFDYIVKRVPRDATYNYILLECYLNDGTYKWGINLGPNVDTYISSMTAPVLVADFDGDGKAELIAKTGEGTTFGNGQKIGDTNGDNKTDYNTHAGSGKVANVMTGPEFISYIDGETGAEINRDNFIARGRSEDWGDDYGARMNFIMSGVCSFDGVKPGIILSRGPGDVMGIEAWEVTNNKLVRRWAWSARGKTFANGGSWHDFHQIQSIDVDGDGKDETSWGVTMMNPDGTVRYASNRYTHGDRLQITDINPNRPGLEAFVIQQYNPKLIGSALYDASTGATIKDWFIPANGDIGRGDVGDVDPDFPGMEMFDVGQADLHRSDGTVAVATSRPYPDISIWWDGDLLREQFRGIGKIGANPVIEKWNVAEKVQKRLFTMYNDFGSYGIVSPYGGRAPFIGDIMGDWREEIILEATDHSSIRVYTSKDETAFRIYTLMQNPAYRNASTSKGYLCSKYTDYFLGAGMATPPKPNIVVVGTANDAPSVALITPANNATVEAGSQVTISAAASDRDGTISSIDFYYGTSLAGSDASAPFSVQWTAVPGTHAITAVATDNEGMKTTSAPVTITVTGLDCAGVDGGTGTLDQCGQCVGGTTGKTACVSTKAQAEDICQFDGTVDANHTGFDGVGFVNITNAAGTKITLYINSLDTKQAMLVIMYANGGTTDRPAKLLLNDAQAIDNFSLPPTGAWTTYTAARTTVQLARGLNKLEIVSIGNDGLPNLDFFELYGQAAFSACPRTDTIGLSAGWNLISTNIHPSDSTIATLFSNLDVMEVKTMDAFWRKEQATVFNLLKTITAGNGYLVNMNTAGILTITGIPISTPHIPISTFPNWTLIGCPYQEATPFSTLFSSSNCSAIKNFEGYWIPGRTTNTIENLEPGKGYFMKK